MLSGLVLHLNVYPTEGAVYVSFGLKTKVQLYFRTISDCTDVTSAKIFPLWIVAFHVCDV